MKTVFLGCLLLSLVAASMWTLLQEQPPPVPATATAPAAPRVKHQQPLPLLPQLPPLKERAAKIVSKTPLAPRESQEAPLLLSRLPVANTFVQGVVVDERGAPSADAAIALVTADDVRLFRLPEKKSSTLFAKSDAKGMFMFELEKPGAVQLKISRESYAASTQVVELVEGVNNVRVELTRGGAIAGTVTFGGKPVEGVSVSILGESGPETATDVAGAYRLELIPVGQAKVLFVLGRGGSSVSSEARVESKAGETTPLDAHLASGMASLEGRVTIYGNPPPQQTTMVVWEQPVNGAVQKATTQCDTEGYYRMERLPSGVGTLTVTTKSAAWKDLKEVVPAHLLAGQTTVLDVAFATGTGFVDVNITGMCPGQRMGIALQDEAGQTVEPAARENESSHLIAHVITENEATIRLGPIHFGRYKLVATTFWEEPGTRQLQGPFEERVQLVDLLEEGVLEVEVALDEEECPENLTN